MGKTGSGTPMLRTVVLVISACRSYGIMQGIHDNYGIMMKSLVPHTGVSYQEISFIIGVGPSSTAWCSHASGSSR